MSAVGISVLASGSNGNCTVVHCGDDAVMVDCGISYRQVRQRMQQDGLRPEMLKAIFITHEHEDHIKGLELTARQLGLPVFAAGRCAQWLAERKEKIAVTMLQSCSDFTVAGFNMRAFPVQHDAVEPVGYIICRESTKVGIATDLGRANQMTAYQLRDCGTLVLESNYDINMLASSARPWGLKQRILGPMGHLSNRDHAELLAHVVTGSTRNLVLAHISHDCNKYEIAENAAAAALRTMQRQDLFIACGRRDMPIPTIWN